MVDSPATLLTMGSFGEPTALLAAVCFLMIAVLSHRNVFGAILLSMLAVTGIGWAFGLVEYNGLVSMPPSLAPTWLAMDIAGALNVAMVSVILAFVNMFDTAGTLMGVAHRANLVNEDGQDREPVLRAEGRQQFQRGRRLRRPSAGDQLRGKRPASPPAAALG